jgi:prostatic aicd phosphatase
MDLASQILNNGSDSMSPLNGYQYVAVQGQPDDSPNSIWIKGDEACPAVIAASASYEQSAEYKELYESTRDFYSRFYDMLAPVYDYHPADMSYKNAYDIFDLINTASIHNVTSPASNISSQDLAQLRALADRSEFARNFNASQPNRSIHGQTLAGGMLAQLQYMVATKARRKMALLAGSYDTFLAFFGLAGLPSVWEDFAALPEYASAMVFELFSEQDDAWTFPGSLDDLRVRWLFLNGTEGVLTNFPLFGLHAPSLPWSQFEAEMQKRAIGSVEEWCRVCSSEASFCQEYRVSKGQGMSNVVAGVVGALVTLGVVGILSAAWFLWRRRSESRAQRQASQMPPTYLSDEDKSPITRVDSQSSGSV